MKVLNLIPLLDQDPLGEFLTDCWAAEVTYEEAQEELKDPEFEHLQDYLLSKKMYDLVLALLDEGMDLDFERAELDNELVDDRDPPRRKKELKLDVGSQ